MCKPMLLKILGLSGSMAEGLLSSGHFGWTITRKAWMIECLVVVGECKVSSDTSQTRKHHNLIDLTTIWSIRDGETLDR